MRSRLPLWLHMPHETGSIFEGRQLNARSAFRLDHARQLEAEIMLLGSAHPSLRHRNLSER